MHRFFNYILKSAVVTVLIVCPATIAVAAGPIPAETQNSGEYVRSFSVFFKANESAIDPNFLNNEQSVENLKEIIGTDSSAEIVGIEIDTHSSPDGPPAFNRILTQKRAETIYRLLLGINPGLDRSTIVRSTVENGWVNLKGRIVAEKTISEKQEVLRIIANPNHSEATIEKNLRGISNGRVFREIDQKILKYMRVGVITVTTRHSVHEIPLGEVLEEQDEEMPEPVITAAQPEVAEAEVLPETKTPEEQVREEPLVEETIVTAVAEPKVIEHWITSPIALKTNMLFLAVGGFNVALEVPIGDRFSASVGFAYAYMEINNRFAMKTLQGGFEGKYWFNRDKKLLTGWNVGVYGLYSSRFDIQWQGGWQGDGYVSLGIAGGYSLPIGRRLNLEFAAAAGAFHTPEVRKYSRPQDGRLMWEETRYNVWRFLPAKLQVNLVWLIPSKTRVVER